jgi:hypothetical protein
MKSSTIRPCITPYISTHLRLKWSSESLSLSFQSHGEWSHSDRKGKLFGLRTFKFGQLSPISTNWWYPVHLLMTFIVLSASYRSVNGSFRQGTRDSESDANSNICSQGDEKGCEANFEPSGHWKCPDTPACGFKKALPTFQSTLMAWMTPSAASAVESINEMRVTVMKRTYSWVILFNIGRAILTAGIPYSQIRNHAENHPASLLWPTWTC